MDQLGDIRLYRRGRAIALVREFISRDQRDGVSSPVIVFTGPGKSALLAELARLMEPNAPCATINCEDFTGGSRELLSRLACKYSEVL